MPYVSPSISRYNSQQCHRDIASLKTRRPTPSTSDLMTFKELVSSYTAGKSTFEDLILEVRCESCFASMFEEAQQQLGANSQMLDMLANEFPIYHQSLVKEKNLEF